MKDQIKDRVKIEQKKYNKKKINSLFIKQCIDLYEYGDGLLYSVLMKDESIYNADSKEWYFFNGNYWELDKHFRYLSNVEKVALKYLSEINKLNEKKQKIKKKDTISLAAIDKEISFLLKRAQSLRTYNKRNNCINFALSNLDSRISVDADIFDQNPFLVACKNCVINLRTKEIINGLPSQYITKAANCNYNKNAETSVFEKWIETVLDYNTEKIAFVKRVLGSCLIGKTVEQKLFVFYGRGRNGKGTLLELLLEIVGSLGSPIKSELLLDQKNSSSSQPTPEIMALKGLRIALASETDEGRKFSVAKVKWLTGGDTLTGRYPHDKREVAFKPSHSLLLMTNNKPRVNVDEYAFWQRLILICFPLSFVDHEPKHDFERRQDKELFEKLLKSKEGILKWLIDGAFEYLEQGLNIPECIRKEVDEYKNEEDFIKEFIDNCCYESEFASVQATEIYDSFYEWYKKNISKYVPKQKKFGSYLTQRFEKTKNNGYYYYHGIALNTDL